MSRALTVSGTTSNTYDADGRRIQQKTGSATTNFLWDCGCTATTNVLLETDVTGAAQARYTVAGGEVVAQTKGSATSYLLHDGQGSVRTLTNASGAVTESHVYDAYGALRDPSGSPSTRYLYMGQMLDAGTGLYNLRARYYNTAIGQFLNRDRVNDGTNFYGYVHGNPINRSDPSGHISIEYSLAFKATVVASVGVAVSLPIACIVNHFTGALDKGRIAFLSTCEWQHRRANEDGSNRSGDGSGSNTGNNSSQGDSFNSDSSYDVDGHAYDRKDRGSDRHGSDEAEVRSRVAVVSEWWYGPEISKQAGNELYAGLSGAEAGPVAVILYNGSLNVVKTMFYRPNLVDARNYINRRGYNIRLGGSPMP